MSEKKHELNCLKSQAYFEYSCAVCGPNMAHPCEHWLSFLARAVAPVETPDGQVSWADTWPGYESCKCGHYHCDHGGPEDSCGVLGCKCGTFVSSSAKVGNSPQSEQNKAISQSKIPPLRNEPLPFTSEVQTRLTAEQFFEEWRKLQSYPDLGNADWPYRFAEAFRDKSEAGLREEIERLAQMHRLVGNDYQYVYGSRHQVQKELAELRVKLTAAEVEAAALRERCEAFVEHTCTGSALCKECRKALSAAPERP